MERWDLYTKDRLCTGKTMMRGDVVPIGFYRIVVHVCIFNQNGELLIQQRQSFKQGWSNMWDLTVGGSAVAGEDSRSAAEREVLEELGLKIDLTNQLPSIIKCFATGFDDIYILHEDVVLSDLCLQYEEVQDVRWASLRQVLQMIDTQQFIPYDESFIRFLFHLCTADTLYCRI